MKQHKTIRQKEEAVTKILKILDDHSIDDAIEILGNTFIEICVNKSNTIDAKAVNRKTIYRLTLEDVKKYGDNITNSLIRQGLLILSWLNKDKI